MQQGDCSRAFVLPDGSPLKEHRHKAVLLCFFPKHEEGSRMYSVIQASVLAMFRLKNLYGGERFAVLAIYSDPDWPARFNSKAKIPAVQVDREERLLREYKVRSYPLFVYLDKKHTVQSRQEGRLDPRGLDPRMMNPRDTKALLRVEYLLLNAAFEEFDHSRDGYITLEEAIRLLTRRTNFRTPLTYEMAQARWQEWLRMFDADKDGRLSMAEISKHLAGKS